MTQIIIQYISDLHIDEWNKIPLIKPYAEYLFLAGDICHIHNKLFFEFLTYCSTRWKKIYYVPGTKEFYSVKNKTVIELDSDYQNRIHSKYKNIFFLNNKCEQLVDGLNVYGSVFWSPTTFSTTKNASYNNNDFNNIKYYDNITDKFRNLDLTYLRKLSSISVELLNDYLNNTTTKSIIITHFPPFKEGVVNPEQEHNSYLYWDNIIANKKININNVPVWISGHTHYSYSIKQQNTHFISNQLGYQTEINKTGIQEDAIFIINY